MSDRIEKVALVAGSPGGIGTSVAEHLVSEGVSVGLVWPKGASTVVNRLPPESELLVELEKLRRYGVTVEPYEADLRDHSAVTAAVESATTLLGPIDYLITDLGNWSAVDAADMTDDQWDEVVKTNVHGLYHLIRDISPAMATRGKGHIVAITGDQARKGVAGQSHVAAAGWAQIGLIKSAALELAPSGVSANAVVAGPTPTPVTTSARYEQWVMRDSTAESLGAALAQAHPNDTAWVPIGDIVDTVAFLLSRSSTSLTGSVFDVSAGLSALNTA